MKNVEMLSTSQRNKLYRSRIKPKDIDIKCVHFMYSTHV